MKKSVVLVCGVLFTACSGMGNLKTRAAFDMKCDEGQLKFTEVGDASYGVEGCGQRQVYVCKGPERASMCSDWVLNSVEQKADK